MLIQIVQHTPIYVFAIFAALLVLGGQQLFTRVVSLKRIAIMALAMTGLSLYGIYSAFAQQPLSLLAWLATGIASFAFVFSRPVPAGTRYDAWQQRFTVPGSAVPLALMMSIFATKYVVGVTLAMHPELHASLNAALLVGGTYGVFSGLFMARAARLWRLAHDNNGSSTGTSFAA